MALPHNRPAVREILKALEPLIIGKELPGFECGCGAIHCPIAVATSIKPAGDDYPGQETCWVAWSVSMTPKDKEHGSAWCSGLSEFVGEPELEALFSKHMPKRLERNPYQLAVKGAARAQAGLPEAACIVDNDRQTRLMIDWGREQKQATKIVEFFRSGTQSTPAGSERYNELIRMLKQIPFITYQGGPDPELPYESKWLTDLSSVLESVGNAELYTSVFAQNISSTISGGRTTRNGIDIVFRKA